MGNRYPGYDVLAKRQTPSWNEPTRRVVDRRLAVSREPCFFDAEEFATVAALAARITPQPADRPPIPVAALIDDGLCRGRSDGYRGDGMPRAPEAWRRGLRALNAEAKAAHAAPFRSLPAATQDELIAKLAAGALRHPAWGGMPPRTFFRQRVLNDIVLAYWSHPTAWSEIGWGGPASPRGYVRMGYDRRDPWEAAEDRGDIEAARRANLRVG
jgi:hypothetical protein